MATINDKKVNAEGEEYRLKDSPHFAGEGVKFPTLSEQLNNIKSSKREFKTIDEVKMEIAKKKVKPTEQRKYRGQAKNMKKSTIDIIKLCKKGKTNIEIAEKINTTPQKVGQVRYIYKKLINGESNES